MAGKKHYEKKKKEIIIREKTEPDHGDYYDVDIEEQVAEKSEVEADKKSELSPKKYKLIIRIAIILLAAIVILVFWLNRDNLSPDNISNWFQTKLMGTGVGDGYPVEIIGSNVKANNFFCKDNNAVILSDTAITAFNSTAKEIFSVRHSFNQPAVAYNSDRYLIYNMGGTNYSLISAEKGSTNFTLDNKITTADISSSGVYGIICQPADYATELRIFKSDGTLKYTYKFAEGYASAVSLNGDGTMGAVVTVSGQGGELQSKVYIFDFSKEEPISETILSGNLVTSLYWSGSTIYAVGDTKTAVCGSDYSFTEYDYGGKQVTAVDIENGKAYVSVSGYSHAGASTLLVFSDSATPEVIEFSERITDISSYGNTVAILADHTVYAYSLSTLEQTGSCAAGYDAKGISMANESDVYVLGVKEIRDVTLVKN